MRGRTQTEVHALKLYLANKVPIMSDYEIQQLNELVPTEIKRLVDVKYRVTSRQTMDTDLPLHIYYASLIQERQH